MSSLQIIRQEIKLVGLFFTWMPLCCLNCVWEWVWKILELGGVIILKSPLFYYVSQRVFIVIEKEEFFLIDWRWKGVIIFFICCCKVKVKFFWQICYSYHDRACVCECSIGYSSHPFFTFDTFFIHCQIVDIACVFFKGKSFRSINLRRWLFEAKFVDLI